MAYTKNNIITNLREQRKKLKDQLETVREFVLSRKDDIEKDIEDFGMLKPTLTYFLEEAKSRE